MPKVGEKYREAQQSTNSVSRKLTLLCVLRVTLVSLVLLFLEQEEH